MAQVTQSQDDVVARKWSNRRKWFIGLLVVIGVLWLISAISPNPATQIVTTPTSALASEPTATRVPPTAVPSPEPIVLSGRGQSIADVQLVRGLARFSMRHEGTGHFSVELLTSDGQRATGAGAASETLLANTSGSRWEGQKAVRVERAGAFVLDISANGLWEVTITY